MTRNRIPLLSTAFFAALALPAAQGSCLPDGVQSSGAAYRICMPATWNGSLVVYAHGYVAFNEPLGIPESQLTLPDGTYLPDLVNSLGFAFATSGYSVNGLAVRQGIADLTDLVSIFHHTIGATQKVFIAGPSEGGIITALSTEGFPNIYNGGLAACGAIGDFPSEINYIGDFRVVFNYFFPGVVPGAPDNVPPYVIDHWDDIYLPAIKTATAAKPNAVAQLLSVTGAPTGLDPGTIEETITSLLWYSVFTTNDAKSKLGGQPYDNHARVYSGSLNDLYLNLLVPRLTADAAAVNEMKAHYNTTGLLSRPMVTIHTTGDQILPYWHEQLYTWKTIARGTTAQRVNIPIPAYGHCNFNASEILVGFVILLAKSGQQVNINQVEQLLPTPQQRQEFHSLLRANGF